MTDDQKTAEARRLESRYRQAGDAAECAREDRNAWLSQLVVDGWTHAQVAEAFGLSRARVAQLAPKKRQGKAPA